MSQLTTLLSKLGPVAKGILGGVAPTILKTIGGPFGMLAGAGLQAIFGTNDASQLDTAIANATPDQIVALKKVEGDLQVQLKQLGIDEEKLAFDDIADARAREMAVKDRMPAILAIAVTIGFFGVLGFMMKFGAPAAAGSEAFLVLLGALGTAWTSIVGYYYGSSIGSSSKDLTLSTIATKKAP